MKPHLSLVACGAPLAARTHEIADAVVRAGWDVTVTGTLAALEWLDSQAVEAVTGQPVRTTYRAPSQPKNRRKLDMLVICPATFNSINKIACGIADAYALGVVCEALGSKVPAVVVPMVNDRLWGHPAWSAHLATLSDAGALILDVHTGEVGAKPVESGSGPDAVARFDPVWITALLKYR